MSKTSWIILSLWLKPVYRISTTMVMSKYHQTIQTKPKIKSTQFSTKTYQPNLVVIYSLSRPIYFLQHKNPTGNGWDSYMAVKNQTHPETKLSTKSKSSEFSFNLLIKSTNFIFYSIKIRLEMADIAMWLRKTKPNRKPDQPNRPKPIRSLFLGSWVCMPNFSFLGYA